MVSEEKHNDMVKGYEDKISKAQNRIKELEEKAKYEPRYKEAEGKIHNLEDRLRQQENAHTREIQQKVYEQKMIDLQAWEEYNKKQAEYERQIYAKN